MKDQAQTTQIISNLIERIEGLEQRVQNQAIEIKSQAKVIELQSREIKRQAKVIEVQSKQIKRQAKVIRHQAKEIHTQAQIIQKQSKRIHIQEAEITSLKSQLKKNSRNSSKPPSSDGLSKPPINKDRSLRPKGKNKSGGQKGDMGSTLMRRENPDRVLLQEMNNCPRCSSDLSGVSAHATHSRQVFDIPPVKLEVTEHQIEVKHCPGCGSCVQSCFPEGVEAPVQYGPTLKSFSLYLQHQHFIAVLRSSSQKSIRWEGYFFSKVGSLQSSLFKNSK